MLDAFLRTLLLKCTYANCFFQDGAFVLAMFTSDAQVMSRTSESSWKKKKQSISSIALFVYESTQASKEVARKNP